MITDISLVNGEVQITEGTNHPHAYSVSDNHDYYFDANDILTLTIRSNVYVIAFADLTIGGSAPANIGAAYTSLAAVFPDANSGSGGSGVTDITYAALVTAIGASGLTAGQQYRITDYATVHYIADANATQYLDSIITGVTEPLIVTASSSNALEPVAYSALHPEDIIHYDFNPANWLDDVSFADLSGTPIIVTGFKGVIYFRHDTLLDNYMGYDFRNCKFRRWKTSVAAWDNGTTYAAANYVSYSGFIYRSLKSANTGNTPAINSDFWVQTLDLSLTEYWNNLPTSTNGVPSDATFIDVKTFAEGTGTATYDVCCRSNHFETLKDTSYYDESNDTILSNNVFFLQDADYYTVYSNQIAAEHYGNTIGATFSNNTIGNSFIQNTISDLFSYNTIGNRFLRNITGKNFGNNTIGGDFHFNATGNGFTYNVIGNFFNFNSVGDSFNHNAIGGNFNQNKVAWNFLYNTTGDSFASNVIGNNFNKNTIAGNFASNTIAAGFTLNTVRDAMGSIDYSSATHVYGAYNTTIFKRVDGTAKLSYCDNSDVIQVVNANA